jgi:ketosteroid isomerase-like protein
MSQENVEIVRDCLDAFGRRDVSRLMQMADPEIVIDLSRNVFNPGVYRGHDGIRRVVEQPDEMWEDFKVRPEEYIDGGDRVVVAVRMVGKGRGGVAVEQRRFQVWSLRDRKVTRYAGGYSDRAEALEAAGLEE